MKFLSEVVISKDNLSADYEISIEAFGTEGKSKGKTATVIHKCSVAKVFDSKGYFHIR